jgi:hypothetical protein
VRNETGSRASLLHRLGTGLVVGATGAVVIVALVAVGLYPDAYLPPVVDFAREFLLALRPF